MVEYLHVPFVQNSNGTMLAPFGMALKKESKSLSLVLAVIISAFVGADAFFLIGKDSGGRKALNLFAKQLKISWIPF